MKIDNIRFAIAALGLLFFASIGSAVSIGEKAPDFTLTDIEGNTHSLSDFAGKVVVLEWTNHGCPFVKKHYGSGNMQALQENAAEKDVVWLTICSSAPGKQGHMSAEDWQKLSNDKGVKSTGTLIDEDGSVGRLYKAKVTPHMYVIDSEGMLVYNGAIDSISSASASDIPKAENYVTAALEAVLAGEAVAKGTSKPYGCSVKYAKGS